MRQGALRRIAVSAVAVAVGSCGLIPAASGASTARDVGRDGPHHFLVVSAMGTPTVGVLTVDRNGSLGAVAGAPFGDDATSLATVITPDGHSVYTTHMVPGTISGYRLDHAGKLISLAAGSVTVGLPVTGATISPDGKWLFASMADGSGWGGQIRAFAISPTGALTASTSPGATTDSAIAELAMTPDGKTLVATNYLTNTVARYSVRAGGRLTWAAATVPTGDEPVMPVFSPSGHYLYVSNEAGSSVSAYRVSREGALTPVAGSPFATPSTPHSEPVTPDGRFVYVADSGVNEISAFRVGAAGRLVSIASVQGPGSVGRVLLTPDGRHLLAIEAIAGVMGDPPLNLPVLPAPPGGTPSMPPLSLPGLPSFPLATPIPGLTSAVASYSVHPDGHLAPTGSSADTGVVYTDGTTAYLTPDQGPRAALRVVSTTGRTVVLSGAASSDSDGRVARYRWSFGDGTTATTTGPQVRHRYRTAGTREVRLVVTDDEGCSTRLVYDGTAVSCRGSGAARASVTTRVR